MGVIVLNYIIQMGVGYFAGWGILGEIKIVDEKRLAYRMNFPVATRTLKKFNNESYRILKI